MASGLHIVVLALCLFQGARAGVYPGMMSISEHSCAPEETTCKFEIEIEEMWTMMLNTEMFWSPVTAEDDGLHMKNKDTCSNEDKDKLGPKLTDHQARKIITADGEYERVLAMNGSVPGPALVVYYGQQLEITFVNKLINEATTIHMHGFLERNMPWMDGVSGLSQCAIGPGETFTYRVFAQPAGTFWYHAHLGDQFGMGIQGALIVRDRPEDLPAKRGDDQLPEFDDEFLSMFQDWGSGTGESAYLTASFVHWFARYTYGLDPEGEEKCYEETKNAAGITTSDNDFHSATVNGMGWVFDKEGKAKNPNLPLEVYLVEEGGKYRFRLISASVIFSFMVSIDHHTLNVIAMDGHDIQAYQADYVVLFPGDRFDFYIEATDPLDTGLYWMRFETLEYANAKNERINFHHWAPAIVRYKSTCAETGCEQQVQGPLEQPKTSKRECTEEAPCPAINCPFKKWRGDLDNIICVHPTDLKSTVPVTANWEFTEDTYQEIFLNVGFWNMSGAGFTPGVNGASLVPGPQPAAIYKDDLTNAVIPCDCIPCQCTNVIKIPLNHTVDLVLTAMAQMPILFGDTHPMHMHGYAPQVIGVGWPSYYDTGVTNFGTFDINVDQGIFASWANETWKNGNFPDLKGSDAARKDTINVPLGGYVIWRFKADNPGFWILHCHTEYHAAAGMGIVFQVGEVDEMSEAPKRMQRCGDFAPTEEEYEEASSAILHERDILELYHPDEIAIATHFEYKELQHAEGGVCEEGIDDLAVCLTGCYDNSGCQAVDWNHSDNPWRNCRCWYHMSTPTGVNENFNVHHYAKKD